MTRTTNKMTAHKHNYDLLPARPGFWNSPRVGCTICGFNVPLAAIASHTNLDAITARRNATQAVRDALAMNVVALRGRL